MGAALHVHVRPYVGECSVPLTRLLLPKVTLTGRIGIGVHVWLEGRR